MRIGTRAGLTSALALFLTAKAANAQTSAPDASPKLSTDTPSSQSAQKPSEPKEEISTKETGTTFKLRVNLVQVRVVVRDSKSKPISGLKREDFQLYDQGKLQAISTFAIETPNSLQERADAAAKTQVDAVDLEGKGKVTLPQRFIALVFDDIHLKTSDAVVARTSAKSMIESMAPTDRIGIFGTSGQLNQDFTNDKALLEETMLRIVPHPMMGTVNEVSRCPDVSHYMANESINLQDINVLPIVASEVLDCQFNGDPLYTAQAQLIARTALQQTLMAGDTDNEYTFRALEDVMRRLGAKPGERVLLLLSPGFVLSTQYVDEMEIINRANRLSIVINTVDARGLYTPDIGGDISNPTISAHMAGQLAMYRTQEQTQNGFVLNDIASGTGGTFFHNSNDLEGGLKRAAETPEVSYMLGFTPQNQKLDGKYHAIKVTLTTKEKFSVQARRGYYAPKKVEDPEAQAKQEIAEAIFSQDEIQELSLDFQTQYFKTAEEGARLSVLSHIDVKDIHFRKSDGRSYDDLTVATVIFDENGNFVTGGEKVLQMRLLDGTYERLTRTGIKMKSSFDLKPGKYLVRQVVRDSEGAQMAARNGVVVVPD